MTNTTWAGRSASSPLPEDDRQSRWMPIAGLISALVLVGVGGYILGSGGDADSVETATAATDDDASAETTVESPSTTLPVDQVETSEADDATTTTPTTAAPDPTTTAATAPSTTAADGANSTDGQQVVVADGEVRGAVLRGGVLYLGGSVPSREVADTIIERAAAIIGEDNIVDEYVIDPAAAVPVGAPLYVDDVVLFAYGSPTFDAQFKPLLDLGLALLMQNPQVTLTVITHTDASGSAAYNQELSYRRGESVAQYWVDRGIPAEQIVIDARGELEPVADNNSELGAQLNRRAEFYVEGLLG